MQIIPYLLIVLTVCSKITNALYFHIAETERKCFIEEIPDETNVVGTFYNLTFTTFS